MLIGKTLGKYRIVEYLGSGGMAEVYKAYQPGLDRYVAIKVLHSFLAQEEDFLTRFQREAKFAAMLRHPNIIQVYDFDFDLEDKAYYMVMELIEGPSLKVRMQKMAEEGQTMPLEEAIQIIIAIANALDYAHQHGTVHRDIKPANIMFTKDGQPILTDFGIAKMVDVKGLTASGAMVGTPAYMAPEQGMGQAGDERSDIYSLGVVLYQLVTGNLPYDADTPLGVALKHINAPLPPPTVIKPTLPPSIEAVIMRALAKDPDDRYQTAKDFARDLKQAAGGQYIEPPPPEATQGTTSRAYEIPTATGQAQWEMATLPSAPAIRPPAAAPSHPQRRWIAASAIGALAMILIAAAVLAFTGAGKRLLTAMLLPTATPAGSSGTPTPDLIATAVAEALATQNAQATLEATLHFTPSPTPTNTPTATPTPDATATYIAGCVFDMTITSNPVVYPTVMMPGQQFTKRWVVRNSGTCPWPAGVQIVLVSGEIEVLAAPTVTPLAPGETATIQVTLRAPAEYADYAITWQLQDGAGHPIGAPLQLTFRVGATPTPRPTPTPTPTPTPAFTPTPSPPLWMNIPVLAWCNESKSAARIEWGYGGGPSQEYRFFFSGILPETELPGPYYNMTGFLPITFFTASGTLPSPIPPECGQGDYGRCGSQAAGFEIVWYKVYYTAANCP